MEPHKVHLGRGQQTPRSHNTTLPSSTPSKTPSTETRNASSERNRNPPQSQWQLGSIRRVDRYHDPRKNNADNGRSVRVGISHTAPSNSWWQTTAGRHSPARTAATQGGG